MDSPQEVLEGSPRSQSGSIGLNEACVFRTHQNYTQKQAVCDRAQAPKSHVEREIEGVWDRCVCVCVIYLYIYMYTYVIYVNTRREREEVSE